MDFFNFFQLFPIDSNLDKLRNFNVFMSFLVGLNAAGKTTLLYKMKLGGALDSKNFPIFL
jgi:predicted AAA+ superfamily ATPase